MTDQELQLQNTQIRKQRRKLALSALTAVFICAALGYGVYWAAVGRFHESTDDAYVAGNRVPVMTEAQGNVTAVLVDETSAVKEGQVLVRLDDSDAKIALQEAEAKLASSVRHVEQLFATEKQLSNTVAAKQATLTQAQSDYRRHMNLNHLGYFPASTLENNGTAIKVDNDNLQEARHALAAIHAQIVDANLMNNPEVKLAAAQVRAAFLNLQRMTVVAPVSGYVATRDVQVGQHVDANTLLMVVVPLNQVWVNANFKESQLDRIRPSQPVSMHSDLFGNAVTFHGDVVGVDAGTGSAFALLPPQNATGNWIKVVQRVPVRIRIDPKDILAHPLRVGLSMNVTVNTGKSIQSNAGDPPVDPQYITSVYAQRLQGAAELIASIVRENTLPTGGPAIAINHPVGRRHDH